MPDTLQREALADQPKLLEQIEQQRKQIEQLNLMHNYLKSELFQALLFVGRGYGAAGHLDRVIESGFIDVSEYLEAVELNDLEPPPAKVDRHVEANRHLLLERSILGFSKYSTTLEDANLTPVQVLQHLIEELLDGANYAQTLKSKLGG